MSKLGPILVSAFFIFGAAVVYKGKSDIKKQKQEIANIDSTRYKNACKRLEKELIIPTSVEDYSNNAKAEMNFWRKEYQTVKDSIAALNSESAKKAYSKGAQAASDTVKTVIKSVK